MAPAYAATTMPNMVGQIAEWLRGELRARRESDDVAVSPCDPGTRATFAVTCRTRREANAVVRVLRQQRRQVVEISEHEVFEVDGVMVEQPRRSYVAWVR